MSLAGPANPGSELTPFLPSSEAVRSNGKDGPFRLKLVRSTWGIQGNLLEFFRSASKEGKPYEAFEAPWGLLGQEARDQLTAVRKELGLEWTALIFSDRTGLRKSVDEHYQQWLSEVELVSPLKPLLINCHSGLDSWSFAQSLEFFTRTCAYAKAHPEIPPIYHETHRGRVLYNPWVCRDLVAALPDLLLTADYSHWVNVCERLIDSESDILTAIAPRVRHIHARVGFENGPQVTDPRAPEWAIHVRTHEKWWEEIFKAREKAGDKVITLVPEYGPGDQFTTSDSHNLETNRQTTARQPQQPHVSSSFSVVLHCSPSFVSFDSYMHMLPYTRVPVANLNEIVDWTASRMQHQFRSGGK